MKYSYRILVINPKMYSTDIAIFNDEICIYKETLDHDAVYQAEYKYSDEEVEARKSTIVETLFQTNISLSKIDAVCARGGLLRPIEGGTYKVTKEMVSDLKVGYNGEHVSNLGGVVAYMIAEQLNVSAFIVDPVVVDELQDIARVSGIPEIERKSIFHALSHKAVARRVAKELNKPYEETRLIVAYLGSGITIGAHESGRVIDVNNGLHGDGPFSFTRAGSLPVDGLVRRYFKDTTLKAENIIEKVVFNSGVTAYLQTDSIEEVEERINNGDQKALHIYEAMIYQISKEIGSMATVLCGNIDGIVITGNLANRKKLTHKLVKRISWIADIFIYPGENDLQALNEGTLRILRHKESPKKYPSTNA